MLEITVPFSHSTTESSGLASRPPPILLVQLQPRESVLVVLLLMRQNRPRQLRPLGVGWDRLQFEWLLACICWCCLLPPQLFLYMSFELQGIVPCKGIQDSLGFWIPRRGFRISGTGFLALSVEFGYRTPIFSGIPDSLTCIQDSTSKNSPIPDFTSEKFLGFSCMGRQGSWYSLPSSVLFSWVAGQFN